VFLHYPRCYRFALLTINFDWHRGIGSLWPIQFGLYSYRNHWFLGCIVMLRWLSQKRQKLQFVWKRYLLIAQKGQLFWHLEMKYIAPLLTVVPSFRVSIRDILVKKQDLAQFTHCT